MRRRNGDPFVFVIVLSAVAIFAIVSYLVRKARSKQRAEDLQQVANELGLSFSPWASDELTNQLSWCALLSRGRSKTILNLMRSSNADREVAVFDYQYVTGHGKSRRTVTTTVACLRSDGAPLPGFSLRPEGTWDKISGWFGRADIDFDTHPKFSRAFVLSGQSESAVRALFTPPVLDHCEQFTGISVEGLDQTVVLYRLGKSVPAPAIKQFLADAFELLSVLHGAASAR